MIFLAPIAGLIAAAVTAPLLTLFYFLKLRRRPVRVSSTLLWTSAVEDLQANEPFRWIRPSWLLFLQLLALACLLTAFARPAFSGATPVGRLILVIDHSASMNAPSQEPGRTRLEEAQRRAIEIIDRMSRGAGPAGSGARTKAMVITFAGNARAVTSYTSDRSVLRRAVRTIEPTDQSGDFTAALRLIAAQTAQDSEQTDATRTRVMLISDGALAQPSDEPVGVGDVEFRFVRVGPPPEEPRDNIGIVALSARRDFRTPGLVRVFVRAVATEGAPDSTPVTLWLGGEAIGAQEIKFGEFEGGLKEGAAAFSFESAQRGVVLAVIGRDDELEADNRAAVVVEGLRAGRVLIVRPGARTGGSELALTGLARALGVIAGKEPEIMNAAGYAQAAQAGAIGDFDLIVFAGVSPAQTPDTPTISFGSTPPIRGLTLRENEKSDGAEFLSWKRSHPLMRDVALGAVALGKTLRLTLPDGTSLALPENGALNDSSEMARPRQAETLALGPNGPLLGVVEVGRVQHVVAAFDLEQSTWPLRPSFVIFLANAMETLTRVGESSSGTAHTTNEPITVRLAPRAARVQVTGPSEFERESEAGSRVTLGALQRAGLYEVTGVINADIVLAVNLSSDHESAIATADRVNIGGESRTAGGTREAGTKEIWHWFVLAGLFLLSVEWMLFAWRTRV